jgi:hypothetical protein
VNGSSTKSSRTPEVSTTIEKRRPRSDVKVTSPKPSVIIVCIVQYTPVNQLCAWSSRTISA